MTLTQTETSHAPASTDAAPASDVSGALPAGITRFLNSLSSGDHKDIGRNWIVAALDMGLVTFVIGLLVGFERLDEGSVAIFGGAEGLWQGWTLYRLGFVFLLLVPLLIGLATVVVPLQIGAPSISYPRLASAAFWTWLVSAVIFVISHLIDGGFVEGGQRSAVELTIGSFFFMIVAILAASVCIVTTIATQRSAGMSLDRVPLFSWSMFVAGSVWLLTLPVVLANLVVIWIDLYGQPGDYALSMWEQVNWLTDQPQIFAFALPLLGIAGDIVPTSLSARPRMYSAVQGAIGLFGLLSFGAYAQRFFHTSVVSSPVYVLSAVALVLPILVIVASWADAARRSESSPKASAPVLIAVLAVVSLLGAGAIAFVRVLGAFLGGLREFGANDSSWQNDLNDFIEPLNLNGTSVEGAVLNGVAAAGLVGAVAGLWFWAPKILGRQMNAGLGVLAGLTLAGGAILTSVPDLIAGFFDQRDLLARGNLKSTAEAMNVISLVGRAALLGGVLLVVLAVTMAWLGRGSADDEDVDPDNPFGGHTLEWATSSPPPRGNFATPIAVTSERPLLDLAEGDARS